VGNPSIVEHQQPITSPNIISSSSGGQQTPQQQQHVEEAEHNPAGLLQQLVGIAQADQSELESDKLLTQFRSYFMSTQVLNINLCLYCLL